MTLNILHKQASDLGYVLVKKDRIKTCQSIIELDHLLRDTAKFDITAETENILIRQVAIEVTKKLFEYKKYLISNSTNKKHNTIFTAFVNIIVPENAR